MTDAIRTACAALILSSAALGNSVLFADDTEVQELVEEEDPWATHRMLVGEWQAEIDGRFGQGTGRRHYEFIFNDQFLIARHASIRLPQELSPAGDHHRALGVYSFDSERNTVVLRQFIIEGYVLQFVCETEPMRFVCVTEDIENGPGMAARMTIEFENAYRFSEKFELANSGEELQDYFMISLTRVPSLDER